VTICVSVKARDGMVLGTDSMSQVVLRGPDDKVVVAKTYSNAIKLFQLRPDLPAGVMSWGAGNIGPRTVRGLILDFSRTIGFTTIQAAADDLFIFVQAAYQAEFGGLKDDMKPRLGMYVAGYSANSGLPEEWEFELPGSTQANQVRASDEFGSSWRGVDVPFTRLHFGFDPYMQELLENAGTSQDAIGQIFRDKTFKAEVIFDAMPTQDAINFGVYVLRTTIGYTSFLMGSPTCGGPLQVAAITNEHGFEWVRQPKLGIQEDYHG